MTERFGHDDVIAIVGIWMTVQPSVRSPDPAYFTHHVDFTMRF
jgi:hypothetical protein